MNIKCVISRKGEFSDLLFVFFWMLWRKTNILGRFFSIKGWIVFLLTCLRNNLIVCSLYLLWLNILHFYHHWRVLINNFNVSPIVTVHLRWACIMSMPPWIILSFCNIIQHLILMHLNFLFHWVKCQSSRAKTLDLYEFCGRHIVWKQIWGQLQALGNTWVSCEHLGQTLLICCFSDLSHTHFRGQEI